MTSEDAIWVARDGQKYGPYAEATVRQWLNERKLTPETLGWRPGMADWLPLSAFLVEPLPHAGMPPPPPPAPLPPFEPVLGTDPRGPEFYARSSAIHDTRADFPRPPSMHWFVVVLLSVVTLGIFAWVWYFVQANWVKKIDRSSSAVTLFAVALVVGIAGGAIGVHKEGLGALLSLASSVIALCAFFSMKQSMRADAIKRGIPLEIGGVTLFFFNLIYMQGQLTWLARWKDTGQTTPPPPKAIFWWLMLAALVFAALATVIIARSYH